jgi:large subunit ribosomal protein L17
MRHGKKFNHLSRKQGHRKALMRNMSMALILHKRIRTTVAKAKALRKFIEPLVTKAKSNTTHSRRVIFSYLQNKSLIDILFDEIAPKVANRPGGYVRIIRDGFRPSDAAEMSIIEFVDFNELAISSVEEDTKKRTRRGRKKATKTEETTETEVVEDTTDEVVEDTTEETTEDENKDGE